MAEIKKAAVIGAGVMGAGIAAHITNAGIPCVLLDIVPKADKDALKSIRDFCDIRLGKNVIMCKDTPGFIANRIGTYWLTLGLVEAVDQGLTVDEADAVGAAPFGIPKTGFFGLMDLVGLDLM